MMVLTDQNFTEEVIASDKPVLVDFWAEWCMPCRLASPIIDELAKEYKDRLKIGKLNVDQNPQTPGQFGIMSIPSVFIFKNGEVVKSLVGAQGKDAYKREINEVLGSV